MDSNRVAFALDVPSFDAARAMALRVGDAIGMLKVGLELFVEAGPRAAALGREIARPVFLDLKLHDIPETVERAVARASALGVKMLTVHAGGGPAMLARAAERAAKEGAGLEIVAVTVLTSLDATDLAKVGIGGDVASQAKRLARLAFDNGVRAFVCSPHEVATLRAELGDSATLITPGVRSESDASGGSAVAKDDQKRVMTAAQAIGAGADWIVIGRPIRDASDPAAAARDFAKQARVALAARTR